MEIVIYGVVLFNDLEVDGRCRVVWVMINIVVFICQLMIVIVKSEFLLFKQIEIFVIWIFKCVGDVVYFFVENMDVLMVLCGFGFVFFVFMFEVVIEGVVVMGLLCKEVMRMVV